ncbi:esterase FE4-like isoform X2 [Macrosteles quadrilineatus]|uniref:esterase FE4-like isoform X2 n=1 Tax=Macrosteles quadrilineatus TaxID=74068 RepID=UPI0023E32A7B|nr:esterase FE4-like isoform X2 [Macrosteles quadrilineatus]
MGSEYVELATKSGKLRGLVKTTALEKKTYQSFQGIPYAKPPIGELRFKPPVPFGPWEGVRDALKEGNDCIQKHMLFNTPTGDEDCLYLNVYTTQAGASAKKAVMVWIHGGGFARGSGSSEIYGPDYLLEEDVVVVTINYRCGVFGFLSLENEAVPGNNGLRDQTLALRWVQAHIESFGGDPGNVTIFGESAGGASVHYHILSPLSKGLFHKAILQSGASLCQWSFQEKPVEKTFLLAKNLGCSSQDPDKILEFLKSIPALDLVKAQDNESLPTDKEKIQKFALLFLPCVEKPGTSAAPFLPDYPRKLMERGEFNRVPVILGSTDKEGLLALALKEVKCNLVNEDLSLMIPTDLAINNQAEAVNLGQEILQFYTNSDSFSWDVVAGYIDYISDVGFTIGLENLRQYLLKHEAKPVYSYLFTYTCLRAFSNFLIPLAYPQQGTKYVGCGASHGDELVHLFKTNMPQVPILPPPPEDQAFLKKFVKAWTTFAKTGNPNCGELGLTWKEDGLEAPSFLNLGKEIKSVDGITFSERKAFWKNIYAKYSLNF